MKRCYPINSSCRWAITWMPTALAALLAVGAVVKPAEAGDKWGVQGKAKKLENNEVMFYRQKKFDEWGGKRLMKLAPGQRCAVVKIAFLFPRPPAEPGGHTTPRSIRLGKKVGVVLCNRCFYGTTMPWWWVDSVSGEPFYRIFKNDVVDLAWAGRHATEAVLYLKTGSGEPPGAGFCNIPPNTLLQGTECYDLFIAAGETLWYQTDIKGIQIGELFSLTIHGRDTKVRMVADWENKAAARVLTTEGKDRTVVQLSKNDLQIDMIEITASPLPDTAKVAESGTPNIAGSQISEVPHDAGAVTSAAGSIAGKWEGTPMSVEFAQTGEIVSGAVDPDNFKGHMLLGTLTKNVLDFWFGGPKDLKSGQLTFAADGKSAKGYFQNASGGAKTTWVLKRK